MPFLGEAAALATAISWAFVSLLFAFASRRAGALAVNLTRITLALPVLAGLVLLTQPADWYQQLTRERAAWLALSGLIGLTLGDWALFSAFGRIGPRLGTLMMTLAPVVTALLAVPLLGERLGLVAVAGMAVTLAGVGWVVLERTGGSIPRGHRILGTFLGFLGAVGQGVGLVLSKIGMGDAIDPLPATLVRMVFAAAGIWLIAAFGGRIHLWRRVVLDRGAALATMGATILGPVLGVTLSLVAVRATQAGIAATLMAPVPVFVLPLVRLFHGETITGRAVLGAVVAVTGVAILVLR